MQHYRQLLQEKVDLEASVAHEEDQFVQYIRDSAELYQVPIEVQNLISDIKKCEDR